LHAISSVTLPVFNTWLQQNYFGFFIGSGRMLDTTRYDDKSSALNHPAAASFGKCGFSNLA
jgi:hypothetical protein